MAKKRKKKPPPDAIEPKGKMLPAEGAAGRPDDAGTRIDDGARHAFFSFKGELKGDLPDATETDLAANFDIPPDAEQTPASEPQAESSDDAADESPDADSSAAAPSGAEADDTAATSTELPAAATPEQDHDKHEQSRAGPVRGPDPAAEEKNASQSQSRKAAGPAHFIPPHESPPGDSQAAEPAEPPESAEPATHTDVRGEPFVPTTGDVTHTEIDAGLFAPRPDPADDVAADTPTETEVGSPSDLAPHEPPREPLPKLGKVASVGDEPTMGSETLLDAQALSRWPKEETAAGSETLNDKLGTTPEIEGEYPLEDATSGDEGGSATLLDAEGVRGHEPEATRTADDGGAPPPASGPDAETVTKDPFATGTGARPTATDVAHDGAGVPDLAADAGAEAEAPSFHDAETASQDLAPIAREAALPPQNPFDLPMAGAEAITDAALDVSTEEVPPIGSPPAPFAGALFEAPEPTSSAEPAPARAERPRLRSRRRGARKPQEPVLRRLVAWARQRLDPRDFLEIVGKAAFERATKVGEKLRTARRENRVSHTAEWWRTTLFELAILYAIVIPIELAASGGRVGSFGVHPHPYWLVVLPLAAARGLVAGLLAAGIAAILYAIGAAQAVTDAIFTFRNMTEPLLFFAVAFFAGELHDEGLLKRRKLDRRINDLEERTEQLRQQRDVLTDANRELEKRIVDDSVQFGNLIQAARRIERAGRQEIFDLALEMAEEHCGAAASVLMLLDDGSLDYLCHRGFPSDEIGKRLAIARQSVFVQRAVGEGVAVNGLDPTEVAPQQGPLVVAPLFDAGGVVKALMCLDEIPLARLNESTVTVFLGIADWASAALGRLTRGADAPAPRASALSVGPEVDIWLGTVGELGKRLRTELARNSRYGVPTSFLTVQATDWKDATSEGIDALDRFILMHFTTGLRPSDGIYRFGYPGAYLLVLAGTSLQGAEVVRTRLERRVAYTPNAFGAIEIAATGPDAEAPDIMSLIARCAKNFRERSRLPLEARCPVTIPGRLEAEDLNAFLRRLKMETSLAVRNSLELHVVGISAEASEAAGPGILARHVVEVGEQTLRPTDGVYMIGQYQCAVILPCTNGEEAATVAHRLATLVRARDPSAPYGQIETQVLGLGPAHPDAGSFLTALARRGKESSR